MIRVMERKILTVSVVKQATFVITLNMFPSSMNTVGISELDLLKFILL